MSKPGKTRVVRILRADMDSDGLSFSLREICEREKVPADQILELVAYGIIEPATHHNAPSQWEFGAGDLFRIKRAIRLQRDLKVNTSGVALALDLIEELEELRSEVTRLRGLRNAQS